MEKFFSILLSFMLMVSHVYLTIGTHYCGGEAVETKLVLGQTHLGCDMPGMEESCDSQEGSDTPDAHFDGLPCCQNDYRTVQLSDEFVKDTEHTSVNLNFAVAFLSASLVPDLISNSAHQVSTEYFPPPLEKDIQILFQTFLI